MSIRSTNPVCHWSTAFASWLCPDSVPVAAVKAPCPKATRAAAMSRWRVAGSTSAGPGRQAPTRSILGVSVGANR